MNKQLSIAEKLATPIEVGHSVMVSVPYTKSQRLYEGKKSTLSIVEKLFTASGEVTEILDNPVFGRCYRINMNYTAIPWEAQIPSKEFGADTNDIFKAEWVSQDTSECGANPFQPKIQVRFISNGLESLLTRGGYGKRLDSFLEPHYTVVTDNGQAENKKLAGKTYGGINFNPFIIDANGEKCYYQRDLVWTLEQKQTLIHSIYNGIEIGKFIFKYNSWKQIAAQMIETGHGFDFECVDGKQRFHAILEFVQNKFPDEFGNYWDDLSSTSKYKFLNYNNLAIGELDENAQAKDIKAVFLTINFTGTPMSKEHIEYVQSIKL